MSLLAVDLGLRTGLALYDSDGRLRWYRSQNFGTATRLRRAVHGLLQAEPEVRWLILEGGGSLGDIWMREGEKRGIEVQRIAAEVWRQQLLLGREQRSGRMAKHHAGELARRIIDWSDAPRPTSLRHDAAEAILVGLWGALHFGLLPQLPPHLRR